MISALACRSSLEDHVDVRSGEGRARILASISRELGGIATCKLDEKYDEAVMGEASSVASWDSVGDGACSVTSWRRDGPSALRRCGERLVAATQYIEELESTIARRRKRSSKEISCQEATRLSAADTGHHSHESSAESKSERHTGPRDGAPNLVCAAAAQPRTSPAQEDVRWNAVEEQKDNYRRHVLVEQRVERLEEANKALLHSTTWGLQRLRSIGQVFAVCQDFGLVDVLPASFGD